MILLPLYRLYCKHFHSTIVWGNLSSSEKYSQSICRITIRTLSQNPAAIPFCCFFLFLNTNLNVPMFYRQKNSKKRSKFSFCKLNQLFVIFNQDALLVNYYLHCHQQSIFGTLWQGSWGKLGNYFINVAILYCLSQRIFKGWSKIQN